VIVADTNLLVYLHLPGEHTSAAERVLGKDAQWAAPVLWRSEFRSVLALYLRRGQLTEEVALEAFCAAEAIVREREYAVETTRVLQLVQQSSCSAYDCEFVALAQELGVPLLTSDARLLEDFPALAMAPAAFAP
jgi:predicted nucleic acid-binding protein